MTATPTATAVAALKDDDDDNDNDDAGAAADAVHASAAPAADGAAVTSGSGPTPAICPVRHATAPPAAIRRDTPTKSASARVSSASYPPPAPAPPYVPLLKPLPFELQVAGHVGALARVASAAGSSGRSAFRLAKAANPIEAAFYQRVHRSPLAAFVPSFYGLADLPLPPPTPNLAHPPCAAEGAGASSVVVAPKPGLENVGAAAAAGAGVAGLRRCIVVGDVVAATLECASVMDVKLGTRLYGVDASPEKRARMEEQARCTTSGETGLRICGMRIYDPATGSHEHLDRLYGRGLTAATLGTGISSFFARERTRSPAAAACLAAAARAKVEALRDALQVFPSCRLYGASVLLAFGRPRRRHAVATRNDTVGGADSRKRQWKPGAHPVGDGEGGDESLSKRRRLQSDGTAAAGGGNIGSTAGGDEPANAAIGPGGTWPEGGSYDDEEGDVASAVVVKLIDFAHSHFEEEGNEGNADGAAHEDDDDDDDEDDDDVLHPVTNGGGDSSPDRRRGNRLRPDPGVMLGLGNLAKYLRAVELEALRAVAAAGKTAKGASLLRTAPTRESMACNPEEPPPRIEHDTHCHVDKDAAQLERMLTASGVDGAGDGGLGDGGVGGTGHSGSVSGQLRTDRLWTMGTRPADWGGVAELAQRWPGRVVPAFGVHPWFAHEVCGGTSGDGDDDAPDLSWVAELRARLVAYPGALVGEIGLDGAAVNRATGRRFPMAVQEAAFRAQLALAAELRRPVSVHAVRCAGRMVDVLRELAQQADAEDSFLPAVILHSYTLSPQVVGELLRRLPPAAAGRVYFGFSAVVNDRYRWAEVAARIAAVPDERVVVESDWDEAGRVDAACARACEQVARAKGWTVAEAAARTAANARRVLSLLAV
ncbi:hypothetical protein HK405_004025 [Cladochytrium tenue]|nr:hypothetical protein HK405_004025 [Cladochytrium tenue]